MAGKALNGVFHRIRTLAAVHTSRACGDRELMERFLAADDEAAFTLLVERHGPMIQGLCRRLLRDRHEADDACQATFLVLARKARSVRKQESLASWLHGVAYRVSLSLRRQRTRRLRHEQAVHKPAAAEPDDDLTWRELRAVLDDELQRLPERYRAPLILCYLEGKTRDEAAQQLGAKPGSLHGLLDRGRKMLRARLSRRGLTLSAALVATALTETAARAALAPALVVTSARAALALVRGETLVEGVVAPHILALVTEASKAMLMTKLKVGAALVVAASLLTGIVGGSLISVSQAQAPAAPPAKAPAAPAPKTESDEEFIRRISKDLRGVDPSPTEIHFFAANKDASRRQKLIDLFIQERQAKEKEQAKAPQRETIFITQTLEGVYAQDLARDWAVLYQPATALRVRRLTTFQAELIKDLSAVAKDKKEVAAITQKYLDQLQEYVKAHPKNDDVPEAMQQITLIYRSQGKTVEADAWRDKLLKEHPQSPAAKSMQVSRNDVNSLWIDLGFPIQNRIVVQDGFSNTMYFAETQYLNSVPYPATVQPYLNINVLPAAPPKKEEKEKQK